jgi:hypothetical protein
MIDRFGGCCAHAFVCQWASFPLQLSKASSRARRSRGARTPARGQGLRLVLISQRAPALSRQTGRVCACVAKRAHWQPERALPHASVHFMLPYCCYYSIGEGPHGRMVRWNRRIPGLARGPLAHPGPGRARQCTCTPRPAVPLVCINGRRLG